MNAQTADLDFRLLFESAPGLFLVLQPDPGFTILAATEAYLSATLTERSKIVGRPLFEVFPNNPDDLQATGESNLRASLARALASKAPDSIVVQKYDIRRPESEGGGLEERFWTSVNAPVLSPQGEVLYLLHRVEDVTEHVRISRQEERERERSEVLERRGRAMDLEMLGRSRELAGANDELRRANTGLEELDKVKTNFFDNISHELRTPLTLLLGPVEDALADRAQPLAAAHRARLELAHHHSLRLLKLVNALLDVSRLEAGRMRGHFVPIDLARRTAELASAFCSAAEGAGLRLLVECAPVSEPAWVDPEMWEKIVLNLTSNAFKFTLEGEIAVKLEEDGDSFRLAVRDTGTGIPADQVPYLFERFHRVEGARGRSYEGTGIGLSLVHELVKLHGGTVSVETLLDQGSTFTVSIPKGKAHLPAEAVSSREQATGASTTRAAFTEEAARWASPAAAPPQGGQPSSSAPRVLLVDDNADMRGYIAGLLVTTYRVELAEDGQAALEQARVSPPDLVLCDVMMPRLDGFGLLRGLRSDKRTRTLPVILLSARAGEEASVEGLDAGADDYLVKPFSTRELLARVRTHVELARDRRKWAAELAYAYQELEAFSYSVSHDLRAPLRTIEGFAQVLLEDHRETLDREALEAVERVRSAATRMSELIEDLLSLAQISRASVNRELVDLSEMASRIAFELRAREPARRCTLDIVPGLIASGDSRLLRILFENLLGNAWKYSAKTRDARITFGAEPAGGERTFCVRDNGAGFDMSQADRLFKPFSRLHREADFEGSGIGLATVQRIVHRHGGRIWAQAAVGQGAAFYFTLGIDRD